MNKLFLFLLCVLLFSCGNKTNSILDFSWLQGKWIGTSGDEDIFEEWTLSSNNSLTSFGGSVKNGDTIFTEHIKIEQRGKDIFYVPSVKHNDGPVDFRFTGYKNDSIIFENPQHDFSQSGNSPPTALASKDHTLKTL